MDCSQNCFFLDQNNGVTFGGVKITDSQQVTSLWPVALGTCQLVAVAVGGGGGGSDSSYGGGGGSGYVEWKSENLTGTIELQISVGSESSVTTNGTTYLTASRGQYASSSSGGDGYSGGGGGGNTHEGGGGSNGQSGEYGTGSSSSYYGSGGSGSGLDLSTIPMEHFSLT